MTETWNEGNPIITNQVANDIPDIEENFDYLMAMNGYWVDSSEADQGAAGSGNSIKDLVDAIGSTKNATLFLKHHAADGNTTTYTLTTSETIPSNITVVCQSGVRLDGAGTLTINGPFHAGLYQVFGTSITVVFGSGHVKEVYPKWWGAYTDGTNADVTYDAIQAAVDSLQAAQAGVVNFITGTYAVDDTIVLYTGIKLTCSGHRGATITTSSNISLVTSTAGVHLSVAEIENLKFANTYTVTAQAGSTKFHLDLLNPLIVKIKNVHCYSNFADTDYHVNNRGGISLTATESGSFMNVIEDCLVQNGSILVETTDSKIKGCWVWGHTCAYGIKLANGNIEVTDCDITGPTGGGGIWLTSTATSCRINNCWFDGASGTAAVSGDGIQGIGAVGIVVNGNTFWGHQESGIYMEDCENWSVSGNHFVDNNDADDSHPDIELKGVASLCPQNTFTGNTFLQNTVRTNKGEAYKEVDGGNAPTLNSFTNSTISGNYPATPAVFVSTLANKTKLAGNVGDTVVTENELAFSPTLTNITIGNGTTVAYYAVTGRSITYTVKITLGSTSSVGGVVAIELPAASTYESYGTAYASDAGTLWTGLAIALASGTTVQFTSSNSTAWTTTIPFTWASGDILGFTITYIRT